MTGYLLVGAAVIVTPGALGDVLGRRRVFMAGLLLFVVSCALIALSGSGTGVIVGRMIQGAAGSVGPQPDSPGPKPGTISGASS